MREIFFRGRCVNTGNWIYGCSIILHKKQSKIFDIEEDCWFEVEEETIGQFTGLIDKNGTKIFEDDILGLCAKDLGIYEGDIIPAIVKIGEYDCELNNCRGVGVFIDFGENSPIRYQLLYSENGKVSDMWVIGNIHDNPKLLEVTK